MVCNVCNDEPHIWSEDAEVESSFRVGDPWGWCASRFRDGLESVPACPRSGYRDWSGTMYSIVS